MADSDTGGNASYRRSGFARFLRDNSLSIAFWSLFIVCLVGEALCGHWMKGSSSHRGEGWGALLSYMGGADFLKGVFGNWQAALLQLFALIVFAVFLRQQGASHSRKPGDEERQDAGEQQQQQHGLFRRGGSWIYRNSLSLAFLLLFLLSFVAFVFADFAAQRAQGHARGDAKAFFLSARFWFDVLQTWQAEFFAMGMFLILSIFLRQENSAESKPVWAPDEDTGDTNE